MAIAKRTRVLCVDDEPNILEGLKVHLGRSFDMMTAVGGEAALDAVVNDGPFAVIVTDMRMPNMNGIQFLQAAKPLSPDTTFIMLTGNHDLETASKAINEGFVFRFLNKPCPSNLLKVAIDDGIERYNLLKEKREVLNDTFVGSIRLMTEVLEISHPEIFSRAHAVEQIASEMIQALDLEDRWEFKLTVRLCRLGAALLERSSTDNSIHETTHNWKWEADVGKMMIGHIPRLRLVAEMVGLWGSATGNFPTLVATDEEIIHAGASIARAAWYLDYCFREGQSSAARRSSCRNSCPTHPLDFLKLRKRLSPLTLLLRRERRLQA